MTAVRDKTFYVVVGVLGTVILLVAAALIWTSLANGATSTKTYYQCVNSSGQVETSRAGTTKPTCGNKSDPIMTWDAVPFVASPSSTTTTLGQTTTTGGVTSTVPGTTISSTSTSTTVTQTSAIWHPTASYLSWDWVIGANPSPSENVGMLDFQGDDATTQEVAAYKAKGIKTVCYIDLGSYEPDRSDLALIPPADIGSGVQGWPGERWLNIADITGLDPLINERLQMCASKGFDGVEVDEVDGYTNSTGFPLTAAEQLAYNEHYAAIAHSLGLSVGLKNDVDQATTLEPFFDWTLNEQCNQYSECGTLKAFTTNNKAIFNAEYTGGTAFCSADAAAKINGGAFALDLAGSGHTACPAW